MDEGFPGADWLATVPDCEEGFVEGSVEVD